MSQNNDGEEHGSHPIGNLVEEIIASVKISDSIPAMSSPNSATTGSRNLPTPPSSIGTPRSGTGAVAKPKTLQALLSESDPEETDRALLASLTPSIVSRLREVRREDIDPEYGFTSDFEGYRHAGPIILSPEERDRVGATVALATAPAAASVVKAELARLRVSTKSRNERDADLALGMQAYADSLAD